MVMLKLPQHNSLVSILLTKEQQLQMNNEQINMLTMQANQLQQQNTDIINEIKSLLSDK